MTLYNSKTVRQDMDAIAEATPGWQSLAGKTVLVTGGNSMLGTYLAYFLLYLKEEKDVDVETLVLTRNREKAEHLFEPFFGKTYFMLLHQDVCDPIAVAKADLIFHFAGGCSPSLIKSDPVGIMKANLQGTFNVMETARRTNAMRVILASTREIYGAADTSLLAETDMGRLDPMDSRSCYPESKRAEETIAMSYFLQYGVPFSSVRLAHVYGPGMKTDGDGRVMSDFMSDALAGRDIVLHSDGTAERAFCYLSDAIAGLLHVALKGQAGEAYNLSNETENLPIRDVARIICEESNCGTTVRYERATDTSGYCRYPRVALDNSKIHALGFRPSVSLREGIRRTLKSNNDLQ